MEIKVITSPSCAYCFSLKKYIKDKNVEFEEINILEDEELRSSLDVLTLPQIMVNDKIVITGFDKKAVDKLIEKYKASS